MTEQELREIKKNSDELYNQIQARRQMHNALYFAALLGLALLVLGLARC